MATTIEHFTPGVEALSASLPKLQSTGERERFEGEVGTLTEAGVPRAIAERVVSSDTLYAILDIAEVAASAQRSVGPVAAVYFDVAHRLGLAWLSEKIEALPGHRHWQMLAKAAMLDDVSGLQRAATAAVLLNAPATAKPSALIDAWAGAQRAGAGSRHAVAD